jgi:hypothetical protein
MGDEDKLFAEFKDDLKESFSKHSIENPILLDEITKRVETLLSQTHPKFQIGGSKFKSLNILLK